MDSIACVLEESFVEWIPTRIASKIPPPVPLSTIEIDRPSCSQLLGYFEQMINNLIAFKAFSADEAQKQDLEDEYEAQESRQAAITEKIGKLIAANFCQSEATCAMEEESPFRPKVLTSKVAGLIIQDFDSIKLDETDMTSANSKLLDLVKLRRNNRDIFNDDTKSSLYSKKPNTYSCDSVLRKLT